MLDLAISLVFTQLGDFAVWGRALIAYDGLIYGFLGSPRMVWGSGGIVIILSLQ